MIYQSFCVDLYDLAVIDYICNRYQCDYDTALKFLIGFYYSQLKSNEKKEVNING